MAIISVWRVRKVTLLLPGSEFFFFQFAPLALYFFIILSLLVNTCMASTGYDDGTLRRRAAGPGTDVAVESMDAHIERLGRRRPEQFKTLTAEVGFCFSLLGSMAMAEYFISGFNIILPTLSSALEIPAQSRTWPASVFALISGAFLLPMGRLTDIIGGYYVFVGGLVWFTIWSLVAGFSQNYIMLICCRAMQGFGPAAYLPSGVMLLGRTYRPGPRKNLIFFLYGAFSPIGFFTGIFVAGLSGQYLPWNWFFYVGVILLGIVTGVAFLTIPSDRSQRHHGEIKMDWLGAALIVPGLCLIVFALTDSSHAPAGWKTSYIYVTLIVGIACLSAAFYVEGWVAKMPLLPFEIFKIKQMKPLALSLFFSYGVFGLYLFYASFYIEDILGATALQTVAWFAPMAGGGLILATAGGLILHRLPGTALLILSALGSVLCVLLFAIIPTDPNYWAYIFPAMVCATIGVDISYSVSNVFITTSMTSKQQGLAGAFVNSLYFLGVSFFLGVADMAAAANKKHGIKQSYKAAFWFGVACAAVALILLVGFVKIDAAKSDLTADEKAELQLELRTRPETAGSTAEGTEETRTEQR